LTGVLLLGRLGPRSGPLPCETARRYGRAWRVRRRRGGRDVAGGGAGDRLGDRAAGDAVGLASFGHALTNIGFLGFVPGHGHLIPGESARVCSPKALMT